MSIDCCKSYVGKQIIGLLPSGGASNKCIWFGTVDDKTTSLEFQNPSASWTGNYWVNGVDGQTNYQPDLGVFSSVSGLEPLAFIVWSLEDEGVPPVGWTGNGIPVTWERYECDTSKGCYKTQGVFTTGSTSLYVTEISLASGYTLNLTANGLDAYTIDDPVILTYLQGIFGGDAIITVNVNYAAGTYSIEIDNVYNINAPVSFNLFDGSASYVAIFDICTKPKCIAWADNIITAENCVYNGFSWSINNSIFPTLGYWWEIGMDIQGQYQQDAGGGVVTYPGGVNGCGGFLWSLEDVPIGTNWQVMTTDTLVTNPIIWNGQSCDLSQACYEVDMPVDITDFTNDFTFTSPNGNITLESSGFQLNDPNFIIFLQSIFGGQATITVTDNVTSVYIKIQNCYTAIHPVELQIGFIGTYQFTTCVP